MDLCTTHEEDELGQDLLENALERAFQAGEEGHSEDIPNVQQFWEELVKVLGGSV